MNQLGILPGCPLLIWCIAFCLATSTIAWGELGIVQSFPGPRTKMRNKLTVDVDTRGPISNGYRSVRVKISNTPTRNKPAPVTADRSVRVVLETSGYGHLSAFTASQVIEIPEQQSTAEATIAIPCSGEWNEIKVSVYEGGDKLEDVSGPMMAGWFGMRGDSEALPTLLFIDYDVPDRATRDRLLGTLTTQGSSGTKPNALPDFSQVLTSIGYTNLGTASPTGPLTTTGGKLDDVQLLALVSQYAKAQVLPPAELPKRWIELSCYDVVFISHDDLVKMAKEHALQRRALVDWLHSGTTLIVYDADRSRLAKLEELLELPPLTNDKVSSDRGWKAANSSLVGRQAGLGYVVAVASANPFPSALPTSNWQFPLADKKNQDWVTRHGMSFQAYNHGIWDWYIPGVGAAPVFSFLLLATLFAIIIGPVNYVLLGRIQRLYLLLITVPVVAALVTAGLFAYAILSDGLGVKARIRSFTLLDQRTGRIASWSRQSYFASIVPSQGLVYPSDTVVWPLEETPSNTPYPPRHQIAWEADGQRLKSGYLSSRTLDQLMVIRSAKTKAKLAMTQPAPGAPPRVTSSLAGTIERLVLRDADGNYYGADSPVKPQENATLKSLSKEEAHGRIRQMIVDHQREYPAGYDAVEEARRTSGWRNPMYWSSSSTNPSLQSSILESSFSSLQSNPEEIVTPGTYFAVVDTNPDVPTGIANVQELKSFHVIVGRW